MNLTYDTWLSVARCPSSSQAILQKGEILGCNEKVPYHCLKTTDGNLTEMCTEYSWIQKGYCAVFDTYAEKIHEWECNNNVGICPKKQYQSNDVMTFSACLQVPKITSVGPTNYTVENVTTLATVTERKPVEFIDVNYSALISAVVALCFIPVILCGVYVVRKRRLIRATQEGHGVEMGLLQLSSGNSKKNMRPYYKTRTYEHLEKRLIESAATILIVGKPGSGKTVLCEMIYARFRGQKINKKRYEASKITSLSDIEIKKVHSRLKCIFILDDRFENLKSKLVELQSINKNAITSKDKCLVITISKQNFENNLNSDQKKYLKECDIVDLTLDKFMLDTTDKAGILEWHRNNAEVMRDRMNDEAVRNLTVKKSGFARFLTWNTELEIEFPLLCLLFYRHDSFVAEKENFFSKPKQIITDFVKRLSTGSCEEKCQYCTLMYIALCGKKILPQNNQNYGILNAIAEVSKIKTSGLEFNHDCCLIIKGNDNTYQIIHEEISELLSGAFGKDNKKIITDMCKTRYS